MKLRRLWFWWKHSTLVSVWVAVLFIYCTVFCAVQQFNVEWGRDAVHDLRITVAWRNHTFQTEHRWVAPSLTTNLVWQVPAEAQEAEMADQATKVWVFFLQGWLHFLGLLLPVPEWQLYFEPSIFGGIGLRHLWPWTPESRFPKSWFWRSTNQAKSCRPQEKIKKPRCQIRRLWFCWKHSTLVSVRLARPVHFFCCCNLFLYIPVQYCSVGIQSGYSTWYENYCSCIAIPHLSCIFGGIGLRHLWPWTPESRFPKSWY